MKKKIIALVVTWMLAVSLMAQAAAPVGAAVSANEQTVLSAWESDQWTMSAEQAKVYAQVIEDAEKELQTEWEIYGTPMVYATIVDLDGNAVLWVAAGEVNEEWRGPGSIPVPGGYLIVFFEEIWEWDGEKAVEFTFVSEYGASVNLREDGLEIYTYYNGTDVDGEAWNTFFEVKNGKIAQEPTWCHAWAWIYEYKLEGLDVQDKSEKEIAQMYITALMESGEWPTLPFEWDRMMVSSMNGVPDYRIEVTNSDAYKEFISDKVGTYEDYDPHRSSALQSASGIGKNKGWKVSEDAIDALVVYAQEVIDKQEEETPDNTVDSDDEQTEETTTTAAVEDEESDENDTDKKGGFGGGIKMILAIGLIAFGGLILLVAVIVIVIVAIKRKKKSE